MDYCSSRYSWISCLRIVYQANYGTRHPIILDKEQGWLEREMGGHLCVPVFIMPPIIKCRGHHVMAFVASVSVSIWFPSIIGQTPGSIDQIFLWLIGGDWRKVPFDDHLRHSSKMATILDLVSVNYLTNACRRVRFFGASLGVINLHHVLPKPYRPYTHRQRPNRGHMPRLALPLLSEYLGVFAFTCICIRIHSWFGLLCSKPGLFWLFYSEPFVLHTSYQNQEAILQLLCCCRQIWNEKWVNGKGNVKYFVYVAFCFLINKFQFLAHLRGAYAIKRRPASSSSVSRARFVTIGAIDPRLCTYVPLGKSNSQISVQSDSWFAMTTELWLDHLQIFIIGISNKDTWHNTRVFDLSTFEGHRGQSSKRHHWHVSFDLQHSNLVWICI
jgi:hypothetical protein